MGSGRPAVGARVRHGGSMRAAVKLAGIRLIHDWVHHLPNQTHQEKAGAIVGSPRVLTRMEQARRDPLLDASGGWGFPDAFRSKRCMWGGTRNSIGAQFARFGKESREIGFGTLSTVSGSLTAQGRRRLTVRSRLSV